MSVFRSPSGLRLRAPSEWFDAGAYTGLLRTLVRIRSRDVVTNVALLGASLVLIVLYAVISNQGLKLRVAYVDRAHNATSRDFISFMGKIETFKLAPASDAAARTQLRDGGTDLELVIPEGFGDRGADGHLKDAQLRGLYNPAHNQNGQEAAQFVSSVVGSFGDRATQARHPFTLRTDVQAHTRNPAFIDYALGALITLNVISTGLQRGAGEFIEYKTKGVLRRIRVSPVSPVNLVMANLTVALVVGGLSVAVVVVGGVLILHAYVGNPVGLALTAAVSLFFYLALGFALTTPFRNTTQANAVMNSVTFPLTFLVFLPASLFPEWVHTYTFLIPPLASLDAVRLTMGQGAGLDVIAPDLLGLFAYTVLAVAISLVFFNWGEE